MVAEPGVRRSQQRLVVGQLLREMRLQAGKRQEDVASSVGQPQSYVSKYETGERSLDVLEVRALCLAMDTSLSDFVGILERRLGRLAVAEEFSAYGDGPGQPARPTNAKQRPSE